MSDASPEPAAPDPTAGRHPGTPPSTGRPAAPPAGSSAAPPAARPAATASLATVPTPPVPLAALLAQKRLGLRQIAGPAAAGAVVHWVHTSEMADPYPYLLGGELLLSAGVLLTDPEPYVARLVEAGAAALGFGVRPVHDTVPEGLIEACDRHGLPLVEVPPGTTFTAVTRAVWQLMTRARHQELRRVAQAQQGLATAAARPDPVPAVLAQLAARLGGRAALLTADGAELSASGRPASPAARTALARLARVLRPTPQAQPQTQTQTRGDAPAGVRDRGPGPGVRDHTPGSRPAPGPASASDTVDGLHLAAYALGGNPVHSYGHSPEAGQDRGLVLALASPAREPGDHTVAGVAVVLLSLLTAPHQGRGAADRSAALVRLLLGASPTEAAGLLGSTWWTVVHARGDHPTPFAPTSLGAALGSPLVDPLPDGTVRILIPTPPPTPPDPQPPGTGPLTGPAEGNEPEAHPPAPPPSPADSITPHPGWTLGVSSPVPTTDLPAADAQASRALRRATATRSPLARHRGTSLTSLLPPEEAAAHARLLLAPLAASPALTETLRCWLSLHGGWDRTAAALGVHRNTVRQRIARCTELLGEDLDDPDVRMELWFALRWA